MADPTAAHPPPRVPAGRVLAEPCTVELVERKSRFLTQLHPVRSVEQADALIRSARASHPGARHHCTALVLGDGLGEEAPVHRSSDDGEPSGTAGVPILQALLHADLVDTLAVVTRYFGGVKLGAGGLVRAYTAAVERALDEAVLLRRVRWAEVALEVPFTDVGLAENAVRFWAQNHDAIVEDTAYSLGSARLVLLMTPDLVDDFRSDVAAWSQGRFTPEQTGQRLVDVPL